MKKVNLALGYPAISLEDRRGVTVEGRFLPGVLLDGRFVPVDSETMTPATLTRRLVAFAVNQAHPQGMDKKAGRTWARIKRAMDTTEGEVELSNDQFDWLFEQVDKCKFPSVSADAAELLWDEVEAAKLRKIE